MIGKSDISNVLFPVDYRCKYFFIVTDIGLVNFKELYTDANKNRIIS